MNRGASASRPFEDVKVEDLDEAAVPGLEGVTVEKRLPFDRAQAEALAEGVDEQVVGQLALQHQVPGTIRSAGDRRQNAGAQTVQGVRIPGAVGQRLEGSEPVGLTFVLLENAKARLSPQDDVVPSVIEALVLGDGSETPDRVDRRASLVALLPSLGGGSVIPIVR